MIRALAERKGIIGISPGNFFLVPGWSGDRKPVGLERMVTHIDHVCQLVGDAYHAGIGSDLDSGFGRDETPTELETIADLLQLRDVLREAGYSQQDVNHILGANWLGFVERILPEAD